jgi:hypothetical protein
VSRPFLTLFEIADRALLDAGHGEVLVRPATAFDSQTACLTSENADMRLDLHPYALRWWRTITGYSSRTVCAQETDARYMSAAQGRFTSSDPISGSLLHLVNPQRLGAFHAPMPPPLPERWHCRHVWPNSGRGAALNHPHIYTQERRGSFRLQPSRTIMREKR